MFDFQLQSQSEIEDGEYPADLKDIVDGGNQQFGPTLRFVFNVYVEGEAEEIDALVSKPNRLGKKHKLTLWAQALLGHALAIDETFTKADLIGKPCRVSIETNLDSGYPRITAVKPAARKKAAAAAAPTADEE